MSIKLFETHIPVSNLQESIRFYTEICGFNLALEEEGRKVAFLWTRSRGEGMLGLWGPGTSYGPNDEEVHKNHFAIGIAFSDLLKAPARLRKKGIECRGFNGGTDDLPSVIGWMPAAQVYFSDPDGHSLEYISMLDATPVPGFIGTWSQWDRMG